MLRGEVVGDGVGDFFLEAGDRRAGLLRHGDQDVIGMPPVVIDIHLGANAGFLQVADVGHGLIIEGFDKRIAGRQVAVIRAAGGSGVAGDEVRAVCIPQVAFPGLVILLCIPVLCVIVPGGGRIPVVQHRIERHMEGDIDFLPVPGKQAEGHRHATAGAFPADHDLVRTHAQFLRMVPQPEQGGMAVVQGGRIWMTLGEAVIRSDEHHAELHHKRQGTGQEDIAGMAGLITAAMNPQDAGNLFFALVQRR